MTGASRIAGKRFQYWAEGAQRHPSLKNESAGLLGECCWIHLMLGLVDSVCHGMK